MHKIKYIIFSFTILFISSCEEVIDLDLDSVPPRLVIDATLNWEKGTNGNKQTIKLSLTAPYFDTTIPPATGANVFVTDSNSNTFDFIDPDNDGIYICDLFTPELAVVYHLTVIYEGETYTAKETLMSVADIYDVGQNNEGGFVGDEIELKAFFIDPKDEDNYYLFDFDILKFSSNYLQVYEDELTNGNINFGFYSNEDMQAGDAIDIKSYGISKQTFEYYQILIAQSNQGSGGGPFSTQPATVRGNCVNQTNPDNYPLGYFRASEVSVYNYVIE